MNTPIFCGQTKNPNTANKYSLAALSRLSRVSHTRDKDDSQLLSYNRNINHNINLISHGYSTQDTGKHEGEGGGKTPRGQHRSAETPVRTISVESTGHFN